MGTWRSLVISMLLVLLVVALALALVPRPTKIEQRALDPVGVAAEAARSERLPVSVVRIDDQWKATSARLTEVEELPTWHVGYHSRDEETYIALEQTSSAHPAEAIRRWAGNLSKYGAERGTSSVAGATWQRYENAGDPVTRALVRRTGNPVTMLAGNTSFEQLEAFAGSLETVPPATSARTGAPAQPSAAASSAR